VPDTKMSRRAFLRRAALAAAGVLAACGQQPAGVPPPAPATSAPAPAIPTAALATSAPASAATTVPTAAPAAAATAVPAATAAPAAASGQGTLRVAMDIPVKLDPAFASSDSEIAILNAVYDYLVDVDHESKIQPRLATKWTTSDDGLTYTFTLAKGVSFHDGSPLTAKDVVWTFDRLRDLSLKLPTSDLYSNIESITAGGDQEVVFKLKKTNPFFLYDLSDNHALILKAESKDADTKLNGSGPFKVVNYSPENRMELAANEQYFIAGKPGVADLQFIFFKDQPASVDALRGGQVDLVMRMPTPLF
jgi:peptide/nickel transport system substrate-binding protein